MSKFVLELTEAQLQIVGAALGELPFKVSAETIQAIALQLQAQGVNLPAKAAEERSSAAKKKG